MLSPGDILDNRYEILAPLAEGGMGAVYRARRRLLGDDVAIKVVRSDLSQGTAADRFLRESRIAASLRHPAVVSILDFDILPDQAPYLVMELLSGPSLQEEIAARGRLDVADVQRVIPPICAALHLAHENGVVHRDIKPANIVAHEYPGSVRVYKIVDFGVANLREPDDATRLTGAQQFVGTVTYAAPEQLNASPVDARSDVYSLGIVVFEMLTGRVPFASPNILEIVTAHLMTPPPQMRTFGADVPQWLEDVVARALAKDPAARWQTMAAFGEALRGEPASAAGTSAGVAAAPAAGARLGATYEVGERIGPGRLGSEVFRGLHRALGHEVAIRILRAGTAGWAASRERFLREAKSLQALHPSLMQVRDFGEEADFVYLVTDFVRGRSVREVLDASGAIPWTRLRPLVEQLFEAVQLLHRRKVLVCGLNPQIMRIEEAGASEAAGEGERLVMSIGAISSAQDLLATLHETTLRGTALEDVELRYIAPELLTGGALDVRSDVFTLGAVLYEMAAGVPAYDGRSMPELLGRMLAGSPADPRTLQPAIPEAAGSALVRALAPSPGDRWPSAREMAEALLSE